MRTPSEHTSTWHKLSPGMFVLCSSCCAIRGAAKCLGHVDLHGLVLKVDLGSHAADDINLALPIIDIL